MAELNIKNGVIDPDVNEADMEISFTCASPEPFPRVRMDGENEVPYDEILEVTEGSVDLSRLNDGASVLKNHDTDEIVGTVVKAWIVDGSNMSLHNFLAVRIRFRRNLDEAKALFRDIVDGTVRNVSLGYIPLKTEFKTVANKLLGYVTRWQPFEVSVAVGVPADNTVGFYRSFHTERRKSMDPAEEKKNEQPPAAPEKKSADGAAPDIPPEEQKKKSEDAPAPEIPPEEKKEKSCGNEEEIRALGKTFGFSEEMIASALTRSLTLDSFKAEIRAKINEKPKSIATPKIEVKNMDKKFDICKAFRAMMGVEQADFERSVSDSLYRSAGINTSNPSAMMFRDLTVFTGGTGENGAGLTKTDHRGDLFVEMLRTKLSAASATILSGLSGKVTIPIQTAETVAEKNALNTVLTPQAPSVSTLDLSPSDIGASVVVGKDLLALGNPDAISFVTNDIVKAIAKKLDAWIFLKLAATTGVQTVEIANIASATWAQVAAFAGKVENYAFGGQLEWIMNASDKAKFKTISKDTGSGRFLCEENAMDGYPVRVGGTVAAGQIFFGDFSNVIVGQWGGLELSVQPYNYGLAGQVIVVGRMLADIGVRNPNGFVMRSEPAETT